MAADAYDVLIVGSGHGGAQVAIGLRQHGFVGRVAIVGAESDLPYERPPLSKEYLAGEKEYARLLIRPAAFWAERGIDLRLGSAVVAVDPDANLVTLADGSVLGYVQLVWAAGGTPCRLRCEGQELGRVHYVRSRADVDRITAELPRVKRVAVIGGGYIGLESAAVFNRLGREVVLVEAMDRLLSRVAGEPVSHFYEKEHRGRGVEVRTLASVEAIVGEGGAATGVRIGDGQVIGADLVVVGIGIAAAVEPLVAAGAVAANGVQVDAFCRTSLPGIYAIGDCAAHENAFAGGARVRLESVQNAHDQAVVAVSAILGDPQPYDAIPWFWSNQYDLKLQTVGLSTGYDDLVVRGDPETRSFSVVYFRAGQVVALDCVNAVKDYVQGRKLILAGARLDPSILADATISLKELA